MRNGQSEQPVQTHFRTSVTSPAEQSRHLARMASDNELELWPKASSSERDIRRGSRPISSPDTVSSPRGLVRVFKGAVPSWRTPATHRDTGRAAFGVRWVA